MEKKYYVGFNKFESQASNEIFPHMGPSWVLKLAYGSMHPVHGEPGGTNVCPHLETQRQLLERYYIALSPELKQ